MVHNALTSSGYALTKLETSGGFLRAGNSTLLIGTDEEKVDNVISIINEYSRKRTQTVTTSPALDSDGFSANTVEVTVGGATVFVVDIDRFEKI